MKILFVCTGNSCRSVLAEGYFKKLVSDYSIDWLEVNSAGTAAMPYYQVPKVILNLLKTENIDVSGHIPTPINKLIIDGSYMIFVMDNTHKSEILRRYPDAEPKVFLMKEYALYGRTGLKKSMTEISGTEPVENLEIFDPIGQPEEVYLECANEIKETVKKLFERLIDEHIKKN